MNFFALGSVYMESDSIFELTQKFLNLKKMC
jgi:hypothetical protein